MLKPRSKMYLKPEKRNVNQIRFFVCCKNVLVKIKKIKLKDQDEGENIKNHKNQYHTSTNMQKYLIE